MEDFGIPLKIIRNEAEAGRSKVTLSMTFSRELGQSIAKQTSNRSVSG
jgi:hypothetical protein